MVRTSHSLEKFHLRKYWHLESQMIGMPNLIDIQCLSYKNFLQLGVLPDDRKNIGLQAVFTSFFPIVDYKRNFKLEFVRYILEEPKYDIEQSIKRGISYTIPVRIVLRFINYIADDETGELTVEDVKEQELFVLNLPLMTERGTFIVNGTERVIISQLHRSPGVVFEKQPSKTSVNRDSLSAHIIPARGSWLDIEIEPKDTIVMRIDRKRKLPITTLLMAIDNDVLTAMREKGVFNVETALSYTKQDILHMFYPVASFVKKNNGFVASTSEALFEGIRLPFDLYDPKSGEVIYSKGNGLSKNVLNDIQSKYPKFLITYEDFAGHFLASNIIESETEDILKYAGEAIDMGFIESMQAIGITEVPIILHDFAGKNLTLRNTVMLDKNNSRVEALQDLYRVMHPGEPFQLERADQMITNLFFNPSYYDLSNVGRYKINKRMKLNHHLEQEDGSYLLSREDILTILSYLLNLRDNVGYFDDIDSLENRRVRSVGELLAIQFRFGLLRMERSFRERIVLSSENDILPQDLINTKALATIIREFFNSSQLSQFMDQTNPISEITHKRRLSALGPGGLMRDRAGFEVRDVHPTHYGRICPIETPEGPNIGLINSLATYARINEYGLIETPYQKIENGVLLDNIEYMSAIEEKGNVIAEANVPVKNQKLVGESVSGRKDFENISAPIAEVNYIEISPRQLVSAAAALIPFLENDDANRALMGSNMQRQAVPLLNPQAPLVGTGFERKVAMDSGNITLAKNDGIVQLVDSNRIVIKLKDAKKNHVVDTYRLSKFRRSNQNTCLNQKALVSRGDTVKKGDIIADGAATDRGDLALGSNLLVAFMPWQGYNFEDSILLSERIVREDVLTSFHIEKYEIMARDTKLGPEEITRDIPGLSQHVLRNLDESGIVYEGAHVSPGDVLVGKVTPKGETVLTAEEKLLMAIFGEKASDVQNSSLSMPPGQEGIVVSVQVFNREGVAKDERTLLIEQKQEMSLETDYKLELKILENVYKDQMLDLLFANDVNVFEKKGTSKKVEKNLRKEDVIVLSIFQIMKLELSDNVVKDRLKVLKENFDSTIKALKQRHQTLLIKEQAGEDMSLGILKMVRVFVGVKRKIQPGDKMAGRHGNKGVVSRILSTEDMPYMEDGTPIDIVLNPLGVPSRMNLGQILETHLGFASLELGKRIKNLLELYKDQRIPLSDIVECIEDIYDRKDILKDVSEKEILKIAGYLSNGIPVASPVFNGLSNQEINQWLEKANIDHSGQVTLYDGRTGEAFERSITVGAIYMLKLNHLVDDKIHARSVGPYSFITQQPLGGKSQFGGQRFGEMEVWALEAYGAAYTLLEIQTYKSDFIEGRTKVMDGIVQGWDSFVSGIPESFKVLVKEIQGLGLNVSLLQSNDLKMVESIETTIESKKNHE